jgi:surface polysaccharide O-acyltransferase-like enzyme
MELTKSTQRVYYLDLLRIVAIFAMMFLHVAS